jgi:small subunit ribosomal protein S5
MSSEKMQNPEHRNPEHSDIKEMLVSIRRVAKVVKGGRRFRFSALIVVGDGKGRVGYDTASAVEVMEAKKKATEAAKKRMIKVPLREGRTLHHDVIGVFGSAKVVVRSAPAGTGIIAGGALRAVFECLGVADVVVKSIGTSNPHNTVKACFKAFENIHSPRQIADRRGKKIGDIIGKREDTSKGKKKEKVNDKQD